MFPLAEYILCYVELIISPTQLRKSAQTENVLYLIQDKTVANSWKEK